MELPLTAYVIPLWSTQCPFLPKLLSNFKQDSDFCYQSSMGKRILCYKEMHPLLIECCLTSLRCIRRIDSASLAEYLIPLWPTQFFFTQNTLIFQVRQKYIGHQNSLDKCDTVLYGNAYIAPLVFPRPPSIYGNGWKCR